MARHLLALATAAAVLARAVAGGSEGLQLKHQLKLRDTHEINASSGDLNSSEVDCYAGLSHCQKVWPQAKSLAKKDWCCERPCAGALWAGLDTCAVPRRPRRRLRPRRDFSRPSAPRFPEEKKPMFVQILGMFDSGTNLLRALLQANFPDVQVKTHCHDGGIWKHTPPSELITNASRDLLLKEANPLRAAPARSRLLAVVRSPVAHLLAWKRAGYELKRCIKKRGDHKNGGARWIVERCRMGPIVFTSDIQCPIKRICHAMCKTTAQAWLFASTVDIWNMYGEGYLHLADAGYPVKVVTYERLVLETGAVLARIATFLNRTLKGRPEVIHQKAKTHGHSVGRASAIRTIQRREWLRYVREEDLAEICARLDYRLLRQFQYDDCMDPEVLGRRLGVVLADDKREPHPRAKWVTSRVLRGLPIGAAPNRSDYDVLAFGTLAPPDRGTPAPLLRVPAAHNATLDEGEPVPELPPLREPPPTEMPWPESEGRSFDSVLKASAGRLSDRLGEAVWGGGDPNADRNRADFIVVVGSLLTLTAFCCVKARCCGGGGRRRAVRASGEAPAASPPRRSFYSTISNLLVGFCSPVACKFTSFNIRELHEQSMQPLERREPGIS